MDRKGMIMAFDIYKRIEIQFTAFEDPYVEFVDIESNIGTCRQSDTTLKVRLANRIQNENWVHDNKYDYNEPLGPY